MTADSPRVLYLADVPVESSYHGSLLIYRLLQGLASDRLLVCEHRGPSQADRRLPSVRYELLEGQWTHPQISRFALAVAATRDVKRALALIRNTGFAPEAVLTVTYGTGWLTAHHVARVLQIPLHVVVHDDGGEGISRWPILRQFGKASFAKMYRAASSRLVVSPGMEEEYFRRYGVHGTVLYPSRDRDAPSPNAPPERLRLPVSQLTVAYAGSLSTPDYEAAILLLGQVLRERGGRLLMYGRYSEDTSVWREARSLPIEFRAPIPSAELISKLRESADLLFVPMSFSQSAEHVVRTSFPAKLTDYTCAGLPMLFFAPEASALIRWARSEPGVALEATSNSAAALKRSVDTIAANPALRWSLASKAIEAGNRYFAHVSAKDTLLRALAATHSPAGGAALIRKVA